jgi:integrase
MRAGELLALHWGDINWQRRLIQVQRNLVRAQLTRPRITNVGKSTSRGNCRSR